MTNPQPDPPLKVLKVDLTAASLRTYRELNGLHPARYPVIIWLSRSTSPFEQVKLAQAGVLVDSDDPMQVRLEEHHVGRGQAEDSGPECAAQGRCRRRQAGLGRCSGRRQAVDRAGRQHQYRVG
jgi:hypothetical protein